MLPPILPEAARRPGATRLEQPPLAPEAVEASKRLQALIRCEIEQTGFMSFARFMEHALYAPGTGYYSAGSTKLGAGGDFVSAPEISPLFGQALATQVKELIGCGLDHILELGAGTGRLAYDLLTALERQSVAVKRYSILEVSAELRERQQRTLARLAPEWFARIGWLDELPARFAGIVIGNEVLDAMPFELLCTDAGKPLQLGVGYEHASAKFVWRSRAANGELAEIATQLQLPDGYTTEVHLAARGLVRTLADRIERGVALFIDYGFPQREYYHPERRLGTLMCHYRHHAHSDPLVLIGLQDITAHLDFTALAEAALAGGLDLLGYTGQARFLINCGILDLLHAIDPNDVPAYAPAAAKAQLLLSPAEMGELFKVIAFGREVARPLLGFRAGDRSGAL
jgi:SAM-dependent MidA family methyltransferase